MVRGSSFSKGGGRLKKAKPMKPTEGTDHKRSPQAKPKVFMVALGTSSLMADAKGFDSEAGMRKAAKDALMAQWNWCERLNKAGQEHISKALKELESIPQFLPKDIGERQHISCCFDPGRADNSGILVVELWRQGVPSVQQRKMF